MQHPHRMKAPKIYMNKPKNICYDCEHKETTGDVIVNTIIKNFNRCTFMNMNLNNIRVSENSCTHYKQISKVSKLKQTQL